MEKASIQAREQLDFNFSICSYQANARKEDGKKRWRDSCAAKKAKSPDGSQIAVFAIADGISEYKASSAERASRQAVESCLEQLKDIKDESEKFVEDFLSEIFRIINKKIFELGITEAVFVESTLTTGYFIGGKMYIGHVGNGRVYRFHQNKMEKVTSDQSLIIPPIRGQNNPGAIITRRLGGEDTPPVSFYRFEPKPGEVVLFCTDGLYQVLGDDEISAVLSSGRTAVKICEQLMDQARIRDLSDDIGAIIIKFEGPLVEDPKSIEKTAQEAMPSPEPKITISSLTIPIIGLTIFIILVFSLLHLLMIPQQLKKIMQPKLQKTIPGFTLISNVELKSFKYNTIEIKDRLRNNRGTIKLKGAVNRLEVETVGTSKVEFECFRKVNIEVSTGEENILTLENDLMGIWVNPKATVVVRNLPSNDRTLVQIKNLKNKIQINLLTPENSTLRISEAY